MRLPFFQKSIEEYTIFYYNDDEFEQYVPLPANVELDSINISLANNRKAKYFLKSLEIRAIPQDNDESEIQATDKEDNNYCFEKN